MKSDRTVFYAQEHNQFIRYILSAEHEFISKPRYTFLTRTKKVNRNNFQHLQKTND